MDLGWKLLIPLSLGWLLLLVAVRIASDEGWSLLVVVPIAFVAIAAVAGLFAAAMKVARSNRSLVEVFD